MSNISRQNQFIFHIKSQCKKLHIVFRLSEAKAINGGEGEQRVLGVFIPPSNTAGKLRVAIKGRKRSTWILDLAHEYVHMLQWFRGDPLFENHFKGDVKYSVLENATEKEAIRLLRKWGIAVGPRQVRRSQRYIAKLRFNERNSSS